MDSNLRDTYNTIAEDWHRDHQRDTWWQKGTDLFLSLLKPGAIVLDAGCAGGYKTKYMGSRGFDVTGIDLSDTFIEIARRELPQYSFLQMDLKDIDALPNIYDGIYTSAVLLHIPKKEVATILNNFKNKLHDGGYLYLAVKEQRPGRVEEEIKGESDYGYAYKRFFSYYTTPELHGYLAESGFEVLKTDVETVANTNWIQIIARKMNHPAASGRGISGGWTSEE